jgi:hypothetical protein
MGDNIKMDVRELGFEYMHQIHMDQVDSYEQGNKCLEYQMKWDIFQVAKDPNSSKVFCSMEFFSFASLFC